MVETSGDLHDAIPAMAAWLDQERAAELMGKSLRAAATAGRPSPERWVRELANHVGEFWVPIVAGISALVGRAFIDGRYPGSPVSSSIILDTLVAAGRVIDHSLGAELEDDEVPLPINKLIPLKQTIERGWSAGWYQVDDTTSSNDIPELKEDSGWQIRRGIGVRTAIELRQAALDRLTPTMGDLALRLTAPYVSGAEGESVESVHTAGDDVREALAGMREDAERICATEIRYAANVAVLIRFDRIRFDIRDAACIDCNRLLDGKIFPSSEILENIRITGGFNRGPRAQWVALPMIHNWCRCRILPA